jgi:hypothetical protein
VEEGLQIGAIVVVVAGFAGIVMYQRWKSMSQTQADLDARAKDDDDDETTDE